MSNGFHDELLHENKLFFYSYIWIDYRGKYLGRMYYCTWKEKASTWQSLNLPKA